VVTLVFGSAAHSKKSNTVVEVRLCACVARAAYRLLNRVCAGTQGCGDAFFLPDSSSLMSVCVGRPREEMGMMQ
jgi:hypothetical protein